MKRGQMAQTHRISDADLRVLNSMLDEIVHAIGIGMEFLEILRDAFSYDVKSFRKWIRCNINKDEKTIGRYMILAAQQDIIYEYEINSLSDAYRLLGIHNKVDFGKALPH